MFELFHLNISYFGILYYHPLESHLLSKERQKEMDEREVRRNGGNREKGNLNQDILDEGKKICLQLKRKKGRICFCSLLIGL